MSTIKPIEDDPVTACLRRIITLKPAYIKNRLKAKSGAEMLALQMWKTAFNAKNEAARVSMMKEINERLEGKSASSPKDRLAKQKVAETQGPKVILVGEGLKKNGLAPPTDYISERAIPGTATLILGKDDASDTAVSK